MHNPYVRPSAERIQLISGSARRVERALGPLKKVLVVGEAGSGKTTLLRWLAVSSAIGTFRDGLESWNDYIPFLITLREFIDADFPVPEQFPSLVASNISGQIPISFTHDLLREGKALLLIDGVDELPEGIKRERARAWLSDLVQTYPEAHYVVTSRPAAIGDSWPDLSFAIAQLQPMSSEDIESFVRRWHKAVEEELGDRESDELETQRRMLIRAIETDGNLRRLAVNPLLCALICALNRLRAGQLPSDRMGIYRAALDMFLGRRDRERQLQLDLNITPDIQLVVLQQLAFWLIRQNLPAVPMSRAENLVRRVLETVSDTVHEPLPVLRFLLERTGLLREPVRGQVDFVHRTFQDYLAGRAAAEADEIELLLANAERDNWRDVIIFAAGHCQIGQRERLFRGLISDARRRTRRKRVRLSLLTVACLLTASQLDPALRREVGQMAKGLIPPRTFEAAEDLSAAGDIVFEVLSPDLPQNRSEAMASIRLASKIGGPEALRFIAAVAARYDDMQSEVIRAQGAFDPDEYAKIVFRSARIGSKLIIDDMSLLPYLGNLRSLVSLELDPGGVINLSRIGSRPPKLSHLTIRRQMGTSLIGIERWKGLRELVIDAVEVIPDLYPVSSFTSLRSLTITVSRSGVTRPNLRPLIGLRSLRRLTLDVDMACDLDLNIFAGRDAPLQMTISSEVRVSRCPSCVTITVTSH